MGLKMKTQDFKPLKEALSGSKTKGDLRKKSFFATLIAELKEQCLNYVHHNKWLHNMFRKTFISERVFESMVSNFEFSSLFQKAL